MTRNDIHSPKNINPALYSYVASYDVEIVQTGDGRYFDMLADQNVERPYAGYLHRCDHCGASFKYGSIYRFRTEDNKGGFIVVGEICAENTMDVPDRATLEIERLRSAASTRRANARLEQERLENLEKSRNLYPEAVELLENYQGENYFIEDVQGKFQRFGRLSEAQANAVVSANQRDFDFAAAKKAQEENASPVVEGKGVKVIGKVLSAHSKETDYGLRSVMTVLDDRGFKIWGTAPSSVEAEQDNAFIRSGDRVEFIANVEKSDSDETFGFFRRPRKAKIIG